MTVEDREYLLNKIEWEGFEYAFVDYSDFKEIQDEEFHRLREEFLVARKKLADYIGTDE